MIDSEAKALAIQSLAIMQILAENLDAIESKGFRFRHKIKVYLKPFLKEMEKEIDIQYASWNEKDQIAFYNDIKMIEESIRMARELTLSTAEQRYGDKEN
jgi:hypothetical protein